MVICFTPAGIIRQRPQNVPRTIGSVSVALSGNIISLISSTTRASLLFVFTIAWVVFAFVILINTYLITRELRILQEGVKKISTGEFGCKIESQDVSNEVKELFNEFNDMSNRLHIYEEQNIEQLTLEIANTSSVSPQTKEMVLNEFYEVCLAQQYMAPRTVIDFSCFDRWVSLFAV